MHYKSFGNLLDIYNKKTKMYYTRAAIFLLMLFIRSFESQIGLSVCICGRKWIEVSTKLRASKISMLIWWHHWHTGSVTTKLFLTALPIGCLTEMENKATLHYLSFKHINKDIDIKTMFTIL